MPAIDFDQLMRRNLTDVFSERDPSSRLRAIEELYSAAPVLYEPDNVVRGRQAIADTIGRLLAKLPPGFAFVAAGPAVGHHDVCCVQWRGGLPGVSPILSGTDVIHLRDGKIEALYVMIDPAPR